MSELIKVKQVYFDTETEQPVLKLEDGSERVVHHMPTGNCWVEYWMTPEEKQRSIERAEEADRKWREGAANPKKQGRERRGVWPLW